MKSRNSVTQSHDVHDMSYFKPCSYLLKTRTSLRRPIMSSRARPGPFKRGEIYRIAWSAAEVCVACREMSRHESVRTIVIRTRHRFRCRRGTHTITGHDITILSSRPTQVLGLPSWCMKRVLCVVQPLWLNLAAPRLHPIASCNVLVLGLSRSRHMSSTPVP